MYAFDFTQIADAHAACHAKFETGMKEAKEKEDGASLIIIDNTNVQFVHYEKYLAEAQKQGARSCVLSVCCMYEEAKDAGEGFTRFLGLLVHASNGASPLVFFSRGASCLSLEPIEHEAGPTQFPLSLSINA